MAPERKKKVTAQSEYSYSQIVQREYTPNDVGVFLCPKAAQFEVKNQQNLHWDGLLFTFLKMDVL